MPGCIDAFFLVLALGFPVLCVYCCNGRGIIYGALAHWLILVLADRAANAYDPLRSASLLDSLWLAAGWLQGLIYSAAAYGVVVMLKPLNRAARKARRELYIAGAARKWPWFIMESGWGLDRKKRIFLSLMFAMLAKLAKADGELSGDERRLMEEFMARELGLKHSERDYAAAKMQEAVQSAHPFEHYAHEYSKHFGRSRVMLENAVFFLLALSRSDGLFSPCERRVLVAAVDVFNLSSEDYRRIADDYERIVKLGKRTRTDEPSGVRGSTTGGIDSQAVSAGGRDNTGWAYKALELPQVATIAEVKARYRELVKKYHPDTLRRQGLPEHYFSYSAAKFREVHEAYECIVKYGAQSGQA